MLLGCFWAIAERREVLGWWVSWLRTGWEKARPGMACARRSGEPRTLTRGLLGPETGRISLSTKAVAWVE